MYGFSQSAPGASPLHSAKYIWLVDVWLEKARNQYQILTTLSVSMHPVRIDARHAGRIGKRNEERIRMKFFMAVSFMGQGA